MSALEIGVICYKTCGRKAGSKVVIVGKDSNYVFIDGPDYKQKKKCNPFHLFPTDKRIEISSDANHEEIIDKLKKV